MTVTQDHWGRWIECRAQMLGIKTRMELARRVGTVPRNLSRWLSSPRPPRLYARNLVALARELRTTPDAIVFGYSRYQVTEVPQERTDAEPLPRKRGSRRSAVRDLVSITQSTLFVQNHVDAVLQWWDAALKLGEADGTIDRSRRVRAAVGSVATFEELRWRIHSSQFDLNDT